MNKATLYQLADELRATALMGLRFAENEFDRERYEKMLGISARLVAEVDDADAANMLQKFTDNLHHIGPTCGAETAVFRDNKLLLIRRRDDGLWALPGGFTDMGETLAETAVREAWEEVGLHVTLTRLLGIFDSRLSHSQTKSQMFHAVFQAASDDAPVTSSEATKVGFFAETALPPLSPGHHIRVPFIFQQQRGERPIPYFDPSQWEPDSAQ